MASGQVNVYYNFNLSYALLHTTSDDQLFFLFLCFHIFMSMSNLIKINIDFMDIKIWLAGKLMSITNLNFDNENTNVWHGL